MTPSGSAVVQAAHEQAVDERILQDGEIVILLARPSPRLIAAYAAAPLVLLVVVGVAFAAAQRAKLLPVQETHGILLGLGGVVGIVLAVGIYRWLARRYVLTNRRVIRRNGLLRPTYRECPLTSVTKVEMIRFPPEHWMDLGTVCFQVDGAFRMDLSWNHLARPDAIAEEVRKVIRRLNGPGPGR